MYLSMFNSGQVCLSVERIYVVDSVADEFIRLVQQKAKSLTYGAGDGTDMGPMCWDRQVAIVTRHLEDAKRRGAVLLVGGEADTAGGLFFEPTVAVEVTHDMELMREETFGPVAAIMRVADEEEAIRLANDSQYGLSGSVFTKDTAKALRIAKRLDTGSVVHNDAAVIYGVPEAPFGGRKRSGLGQTNGRHGLRGFTHAQPILLDRWQLKRERIWYPYTEESVAMIAGTLKYGFGSAIARRLMS